MTETDPRLVPARPDLAAAHLAGTVTAGRYVPGEERVVVEPAAPLKKEPSNDGPQETEILAGERFTVYETIAEGWCWGQLSTDGYVGWVPSNALAPLPKVAPSAKVTATRTLVFPGPSIKLPVIGWLPLGSPVGVVREVEANGRRFAVTASGGHVDLRHLGPLDRFETDPVAVAERFLEAPYLWGGRTAIGLDCSGLVQAAYRACGVEVPRDSDLQEARLGTAVGLDPDGFRRGDVLCWPGHVALVRDRETMIHANAFHMKCAIEPTRPALTRIAAAGYALRSVKRVG